MVIRDGVGESQSVRFAHFVRAGTHHCGQVQLGKLKYVALEIGLKPGHMQPCASSPVYKGSHNFHFGRGRRHDTSSKPHFKKPCRPRQNSHHLQSFKLSQYPTLFQA